MMEERKGTEFFHSNRQTERKEVIGKDGAHCERVKLTNENGKEVLCTFTPEQGVCKTEKLNDQGKTFC